MSRNRLRNSQSLHWMGVVKWILITGLLASLGLCYMLCKNQNLHLADETFRLEKQLHSIEARNTELALDLQGMKSMTLLQQRLKDMHSTLVGWGDPSATWVRLDQNTRSRLARMNAMPKAGISINPPPPVASSTTTQGQQ